MIADGLHPIGAGSITPYSIYLSDMLVHWLRTSAEGSADPAAEVDPSVSPRTLPGAPPAGWMLSSSSHPRLFPSNTSREQGENAFDMGLGARVKISLISGIRLGESMKCSSIT